MGSGTTFVSCGLALAVSLPLTAQSCLTRIMCVGDSITEGYGVQTSYRRDLWHLLRGHGCAIDMVGSRNGIQSLNVPAACDFDMDHESVVGITAFAVAQNPPSAAGADIVLLLLGANDIYAVLGGPAPNNTPAFAANWVYDQLKIIIDQMNQSTTGRLTILVGEILPGTAIAPVSQATMDSAISQTNALLPNLTSFGNVAIVNLAGTTYTTGAHTIDGLHPNAAGEAIIAAAWDGALVALTTASPVSATSVGYGRPCLLTGRAPITLAVAPVPTQGATIVASYGNLVSTDAMFLVGGTSTSASPWPQPGGSCFQLIQSPGVIASFTGSTTSTSIAIPSSGALGLQFFLQLAGVDSQSQALASNGTWLRVGF